MSRSAVARARLGRTRYPDIPSVDQLHLAEAAPAPLRPQLKPSPGLASPLIEEARKLNVHPDFKYLSDLQLKNTHQDHEYWKQEFARVSAGNNLEERRAVLKKYIECAYEPEPVFAPADTELVKPKWTLTHPNSSTRDAFAYIESHWGLLVKSSVSESGGSLIQNQYPFLIPAGRFRESYYWDTCFGVDGLLASGRCELARMQADNLLENIRRFGFIPNGSRDYYLSRSQVPLSASMIRKIVEASHLEYSNSNDTAGSSRLLRWVRERAVPLLEREFLDFWSDSTTRFDAATGLHHHWDELNIKRPERFSADIEDHLGASFRDVRASAESGLDFTDICRGKSGKNESSQFASVLLNAVLCGFIRDLAWLAGFAKMESKQKTFLALQEQRCTALNKYLWDDVGGAYRHYHLKDKTQSEGLCFTTYAPLYARACTPAQAARVVEAARVLESNGGICASTLRESSHQWDGPNGWAPAQMLAVEGLLNYGYVDDARRIAEKWISTLSAVHSDHQQFFERVDVDTRALPSEGYDKYPVQEGFLWTNASFVWMLSTVMAKQFEPIDLAAENG
ncbi:trehalase family glycosidase [Stenotrophobium rhamnosiphilum]|nr:trehalase family glycosidase [Stenotrophobium rhamnosiphilum]